MTAANPFSWFNKATVKHLRLPFSWHLMPVYLFALSQTEQVQWPEAILSFFILHFLIYPSSNCYNSYQDRDEGAIGGLKNPPPVTKDLLFVSVLFDVAGLALSAFVNLYFAFFVLLYVLVSRAYQRPSLWKNRQSSARASGPAGSVPGLKSSRSGKRSGNSLSSIAIGSS